MKHLIPKVPLSDWEAVGGYMRLALYQYSHELGGEELWLQVEDLLSDPHDILPSSYAIKFLEDRYPGSTLRVLELAEQLQPQVHNWIFDELPMDKQLTHLFSALVIVAAIAALTILLIWLKSGVI